MATARLENEPLLHGGRDAPARRSRSSAPHRAIAGVIGGGCVLAVAAYAGSSAFPKDASAALGRNSKGVDGVRIFHHHHHGGSHGDSHGGSHRARRGGRRGGHHGGAVTQTPTAVHAPPSTDHAHEYWFEKDSSATTAPAATDAATTAPAATDAATTAPAATDAATTAPAARAHGRVTGAKDVIGFMHNHGVNQREFLE